MIPSRRSFLTGLAATIITAPAIVRAGSLMPVKVMEGDVISGNCILQAMEALRRMPRMPPLMIDGKPYYVMRVLNEPLWRALTNVN